MSQAVTQKPATRQPSLSRLEVPDEADVPAELRRTFDTFRRTLGYVPNWAKAFSLGGAHAVRFNEYILPFLDPLQGRLPHVERELVSTVVSAENGCAYCRLNHAQTLGQALGDTKLAKRISLDYRHVDELSERQRSLSDFAAKITHTPREISERDFDVLRSVGLDDEDIFEVVQLASLFSAANRISIVLNVVPDDEFFEDIPADR